MDIEKWIEDNVVFDYDSEDGVELHVESDRVDDSIRENISSTRIYQECVQWRYLSTLSDAFCYFRVIDEKTYELFLWGKRFQYDEEKFEEARNDIERKMLELATGAIACGMSEVLLFFIVRKDYRDHDMHYLQWKEVFKQSFVHAVKQLYSNSRIRIRRVIPGRKIEPIRKDDSTEGRSIQETSVLFDDAAIEKYGDNLSVEIRFANYLDELFEKRAIEDINSGRFPVVTSKEKAINNWRREFNSRLSLFFGGNPSLVSRLESGKSLSTNNRSKLLYICWALHISTEEVNTLMLLGGYSPLPQTNNERLLRDIIENKSYKADNPGFIYANGREINLYEVVGIDTNEIEYE